MNSKALNVLMFSREPSWPGGVVDYVSMLEGCLSGDIRVIRFIVGRRRTGIRSRIGPVNLVIDTLRLTYVLLRYRIDVVHINPSLNVRSVLRDGVFLFIMKVLGTKNIVVFMHGWDEELARRISGSALAAQLARDLLGQASRIFVLSSRFKDYLCGIGVGKELITVTTTMFDGGIFKNIDRSRNDDQVRIIFLSRMVREKGIYDLLDAFLRLKDKYPGLTLIYAGDGAEEEILRDRVNDCGIEGRVSFLGFLRGSHKAEILINSDIFVLPSYSEGLPVSMLEAFAAGLPVITTAVGGIPDIFQDGVNGVLLDRVDAGLLASAIGSLVENKAKREEIGRHNKDIAWRCYEARRVTEQIESIYKEGTLRGRNSG